MPARSLSIFWTFVSLLLLASSSRCQTVTGALTGQISETYAFAPSYAIRHIHGKTQYLYLTADQKRASSVFGYETAKLVLAENSSRGIATILWQYDLPVGGIGVCWWGKNGGRDNAILVNLYGGMCLKFDAPESTLPKFAGSFQIAQTEHRFLMRPETTFVSHLDTSNYDRIFYSYHSLIVLDPEKGTTTDLYRLPVFRETSSNFLTVKDVDGDGTTDIIADTGREITGRDGQNFPSTLQVWHFKDSRYERVYQGPPHQSIVTSSIPMKYSATARPGMLAQEAQFALKGAEAPDVPYVLHLYQWDGKTITDIANMAGAASNISFGQFTVADLNGDGVDELIGVEGGKTSHIVVYSYKDHNFVKKWASPAVPQDLHFGRPDDYENTGRQQVPLSGGDNDRFSLFKLVSGKYAGWESLRLPPSPPPPPPLALDVRFHWEVSNAISSDKQPRNMLVLDGNNIIQVFPNTREINGLYRTQQVQERILALARQKFPAAQVVSRKSGDEDEEPKMEVAAGKTVIITLTQSEAKAQGKTLAAYAQEWVSTVQTILKALAVPKR